MVVIAAAVCTNTGRTLISRQFVDISRSRVEGLLASFPKLVSSEQEHTFIETENVRYVYQPLENLFVLLITNKSSNIMEDLDTLHLLAKLVPDYCGSLETSQILKNSFELIFAIDEVIVGGFKEKVTIPQIKTLTEMDSHEERIHEIVERNKAREATEQAKLKIKEIELQKKMGKISGISSSNYSGGGGGYSGGSSYSKEPSVQKSEPKAETYRGGSSAPKKGMQLKSKTSGQSDVLKALKDAGEITDAPTPKSSAGAPAASSAAPAQKKESVHVEVEEILSLAINQDGGVEELEIRGGVKLEIAQPEAAHILLKLKNVPKDLQSQTHPTLDKVRFAKESTLALKDSAKTFPTKTSLGLLKWRFVGSESDIPLSVTCWPTPGGEMTTVNLEFNLLKPHLELEDVSINIPIPDGHTPVVDSADGSYDYQARASILSWRIPLINAENKEGTMEFSVPYRGDSSGFFPVGVKFQSSTLFTGIEVASVNKVTDGSPVKFSSIVSFAPKADGFQLQWA